MVQSLDEREQEARIAIIGMACRLPGDIGSPHELWRLVSEGRDAVDQPSPNRAAQFPPADAGALPGAHVGGFLTEVADFDAEFFGISGREADVLDPQQRLLLEVSWEALEHAGLPPGRLSGTATGVFTGLSYHDYMDGLAGQPGELAGSVLTNGHCVAAGRVSYVLGLHGPAVSLDTACSSSLVALHLAAQALRAGECDLALAGGVSLILSDRTTRSFVRMRMLSPTGRCRSFDAAADGFVRGEGCVVIVVKRLADALADGDRVLAVIRGSAVNQDGRSDGLAAPSAEAQTDVIRQALAVGGIDPRDVGMIEAHGTGTPVGDPVEFRALAQHYGVGRGRCALGSVKTNIGHLEPAAGLAGLAKAVLALQHGLVPPSLHFTRWNPKLHAQGTRLFVPTAPTPWPVDGSPRLAAVSSFGFSGTNAHVILEQSPQVAVAADSRDGGPEVFLVAAGSPRVLPRAAQALAGWLETDGAGKATSLGDLAYTLAVRRPPGRGRLGVVAGSRGELIAALRSHANGHAHPAVVSGEVAPGVTRKPVWVFSGQGSQWAGMGRVLLEREPAFAAALRELDPLIAAEAGFSVLELVRSGEPVAGCARVQPVLFALQVALAAAWRAHGSEPAAVVGHSMGEVAAAVVAGALSAEDGARVICRRSNLLSRIAGRGAMASVGLGREAVEAEVARATGVSIAVLASPNSTVIAGDPAQIEDLVAAWVARGIPAQLIAVDVASHCAQVDPLLDELADALAELAPKRASVPFYSTVLDDPRRIPDFDAAYWCANLRRPVRFASAIQAAAADRHTLYVELSPHPVLRHAVTEILLGTARGPVVLPTLVRDEDDAVMFRTQLAAVYCAGGHIDWSELYPHGVLVEPPFVSFDRRRHWTDLDAGSPTHHAPGRAFTDGLPGAHTELPGTPVHHCWSAQVGTDAVPWLADHRVHGTAVFPAAGYVTVALSVARTVFQAAADEVEAVDLRFDKLLPLAEHTELKTVVTMRSPNHADTEIFGRSADDPWELHARVGLRRKTSAGSREHASPTYPTANGHNSAIDPALFYTALRTRGLEHDGAFAALTELAASPDGTDFWARVQAPTAESAEHGELRIQTILLDLCAQVVMTGLVGQRDRGLVLPVSATAARLLGDPRTAKTCHARITKNGGDCIVGDIRLLDASGMPVAAMDGLTFRRHGDSPDQGVDRWFLETTWSLAKPAPTTLRPEGTWAVLGVDGHAEDLANALRAAGVAVDRGPKLRENAPLGVIRGALAEHWNSRSIPSAVALVLPPRLPGDAHEQALRHTRTVLDVAQAIATCVAKPPRLYVLTHLAHDVEPGYVQNIAHGTVRGVIRVLACEHPEIRATQVDRDLTDAGLNAVVRELLALDAEDEVVVRSGNRYVARLARAPKQQAEPSPPPMRVVSYGKDGFRLRVGQFGDLSRVELAVHQRREPGPGEVEVRILAAGLNFRDVLTAMGLLGTDAQASARIGFECCGEVTAVAPDVEHLRVGDTVVAADLRGGSFASFVTLPATFAARLPPGIDPIAAAGIPTAFTTAWYALRHVARLKAPERILVHCATGGTGLGALQVAELLGCRTLATAGNPDKRGYLRGLGIEHVMDSRTTDFGEQTRAATGGAGVDVVLNSLSGPAISAGLRALRPFGRFVELGVRDIIENQPLGMAPLRHNITLSTVDLIELQRARPAEFAAVLRAVLAEIAHGRLTTLPYRAFPLAEASDAFRFMAGAGHIGKLVLTLPETGRTRAVAPAPPIVRHDGSYLVSGGLRGVGLQTARWLIEQGAGHVIINGRTGPTPEAQGVLTQLRARGARITVVLGDITEPGVAERLVDAADGMQLRGIVHAAMVLDDAAVANVSEDQLIRVWQPKVVGAWRLHEAAAQHRPDWFVLYSSMASQVGNAGQATYAAANSWLDAFAAWRTRQGQRTLAINWGPWGETGAATDFAERGYHTIPTARGLQALGELLATQRANTGVIPGEPATWIPRRARHSRFFTTLHADSTHPEQEPAPPQSISTKINSLDTAHARRTALEQRLTAHIREVLRLRDRDVDPQTPLKNLGFDSLLSMELRAHLQTELGIPLSTDFVYRHTTIAALAEALEERLSRGEHSGEPPSPVTAHSSPAHE